ncbi:cyclase family protein [bacterium]|nr:cyclase family protein [bacterium]
MRHLLHPSALLAASLLTVSCDLQRAPAEAAPPVIIDLSHTYDDTTVYWPTAEGFQLRQDSRGWNDRGFYYEANTFTTAEHGGTHLDAPVHFAEGMRSVDEIPLDQLIGPGVVVDVTEACAADRDHLVSLDELLAHEAAHGEIPDGAIVLLFTGFSRRWPDRASYMGTEVRGAEGVQQLHFPGLHPDAARWLVEERGIGAVGLDTPSIDHGPSVEFLTHRALFEANVPAFENVANLHQLPPRGAEIIALPMKIRRGSGAPARIIAVLHGERGPSSDR